MFVSLHDVKVTLVSIEVETLLFGVHLYRAKSKTRDVKLMRTTRNPIRALSLSEKRQWYKDHMVKGHVGNLMSEMNVVLEVGLVVNTVASRLHMPPTMGSHYVCTNSKAYHCDHSLTCLN